MVDLSIILPTYNERENISVLIPLLEGILKEDKINGEIIVVDDSSPDGTAKEAEHLDESYKNIRIVRRNKKEGIGAALREGYNQAKGNVILSMDSDMSFDTAVMLELIKKVNNGYDLVVGRKIKYEAQTFKKTVQKIISKAGNRFMSLITGIDIHDFSANFRAMKKEVWNAINTKEKTNVFLFEMVLLANHHGFKVGELPVVFKDRIYGKSKINMLKEIPKFLIKSVILTFKSRLNLIK